MKKIVFFFNQMLSPTLGTGGDVFGYEMLGLANKDPMIESVVVAPKSAKKVFHKSKVFTTGFNFFDKHFFKFNQVYTYFFVYIGRTFEVIFKKKKFPFSDVDVFYLAGDFFVNVIPAVLLKKSNGGSKFFVMIFHLNKSPFFRKEVPFLQGLVSYLSQRFSFYFIKRHADTIFVLSEIVKKELLDLGFKNKIIVSGAGLHTNKFERSFADTKKFSKRKIDLVFFNRLDYTKGVFDLPKIVANIKKENSNITLHIIGSGRDEIVKKLKSEFKRYSCLKNVTFHGYVKNKKDVYKILNNSKVFLQPSYEEGWSIVLFEAILCGCLPVVYNLPIYKEVFGDLIDVEPVGDVNLFSSRVNIVLAATNSMRMRYLEPLFLKAREHDWAKVYEMQMKSIKN